MKKIVAVVTLMIFVLLTGCANSGFSSVLAPQEIQITDFQNEDVCHVDFNIVSDNEFFMLASDECRTNTGIALKVFAENGNVVVDGGVYKTTNPDNKGTYVFLPSGEYTVVKTSDSSLLATIAVGQ